jgi:hypothetical protein
METDPAEIADRVRVLHRLVHFELDRSMLDGGRPAQRPATPR